ncbi:MAG: Protein of unknown function (DUF1553)/Protein of unknown function (DUF1549)/Planctomycete [Planctomycetota bacterium]|nr:Protein of unknown function (DUF1553)/Protein of unknown function (DUF1549)/Planctomycete [Planctomycetota bacterium]
MSRLRIVAGFALLMVGRGVAADDFRDKVAPILEARCVRCHGETAKKGGLALHTAEAMKAGGESGAAIEPGKPGESLLIEKITGVKPEMPKGGKPLSANEVAAIRRWIEAGAEWPKGLALKEPKAAAGPWWAIQPLNRPKVPQATNWARNPIDAFVLSAMVDRKLAPGPEAGRATLIRRLTFDLHGLPPSPEDIQAFLNDKRPDAYERLVGRLLASPRYGERWGRHWLDVAHYGDTHGYDKDKPRRNAWRYRDYVIKSLNDDKPYARFVREQVAGDVLFPGNNDATTATGFLAAGPWDFVGHAELREGTVDKEKTRLIDRDDVLANVMSTFSSLTVHCARCHDHKFDPIPQKEYYGLQAVFAGIERGDRPVEGRQRAETRLALVARIKELTETHKLLVQKSLALSGPDLVRLDDAVRGWRREIDALPKRPVVPSPSNGYHSSIHPKAEATAWVQVDLGASVPIEEIRLLPARPVDFADTPGFGFPSRFRVEISDDSAFAKSETLFEDDRPDAETWPDEPLVIRAGKRTGRFVRVSGSRLWKRTGDYVFALSELEVLSGGRNVAFGKPVTALDTIEGGLWGSRALVDGFTSRDRRPDAGDAAETRRSDLLVQIQQASTERRRVLAALVPAELRAEIDGTVAEIARTNAAVQSLPPTEMVYAPIPRPPRPIRLLRRGDVEQPADPVGPGALACVPGLNANFDSTATGDEGARRAALAEWLVHRDNVLTWRSIANRVWHNHFGRGIVETPNDFGKNGGLPSHPELLDWLAVEFRDGGGSLKTLHRVIVTSATYRQSSANDAAKSAIDADNRFLWRQNRRRLEAEAVRDSVLAASGQLDLTMGGPGFEPFRFKDDHSPIYDHEAIDRINAPECRRRTVYRFAVRSVPNPFVECLDGADPNAMTPVRNTTITALQALTLLNDPFMIRQSEVFAARLEAMGTDRRKQVESAFLLAYGRPPQEDERNALLAYAARHGMAKACRVMFNGNEFVFID